LGGGNAKHIGKSKKKGGDNGGEKGGTLITFLVGLTRKKAAFRPMEGKKGRTINTKREKSVERNSVKGGSPP